MAKKIESDRSIRGRMITKEYRVATTNDYRLHWHRFSAMCFLSLTEQNQNICLACQRSYSIQVFIYFVMKSPQTLQIFFQIHKLSPITLIQSDYLPKK